MKSLTQNSTALGFIDLGPSTQHDHVFRQSVETERFHASRRLGGREARDLRHGGARSRVKKYPLTGDRPPASVAKLRFNFLRTHEPAAHQIQLSETEPLPPADRIVLLALQG